MRENKVNAKRVGKEAQMAAHKTVGRLIPVRMSHNNRIKNGSGSSVTIVVIKRWKEVTGVFRRRKWNHENLEGKIENSAYTETTKATKATKAEITYHGRVV
jgi:hypothetical protein